MSFYVVQNVKTFLSASTHQRNVLKSQLQQQKTLEVISNTTWSVKANVMLAMKEGNSEITNSLISLQQKMISPLPSAEQNLWRRDEMRCMKILSSSLLNYLL
jgi:hypothetical protein